MDRQAALVCCVACRHTRHSTGQPDQVDGYMLGCAAMADAVSLVRDAMWHGVDRGLDLAVSSYGAGVFNIVSETGNRKTSLGRRSRGAGASRVTDNVGMCESAVCSTGGSGRE